MSNYLDQVCLSGRLLHFLCAYTLDVCPYFTCMVIDHIGDADHAPVFPQSLHQIADVAPGTGRPVRREVGVQLQLVEDGVTRCSRPLQRGKVDHVVAWTEQRRVQCESIKEIELIAIVEICESVYSSNFNFAYLLLCYMLSDQSSCVPNNGGCRHLPDLIVKWVLFLQRHPSGFQYPQYQVFIRLK